jgi:rhodanese-related sulfurtransferase
MRRFSVAALCLLVACGSNRAASSGPLTDAEKLETLGEMVSDVRDRYPEVQGVSADQVSELVRLEDAVLVDVRTAAERLVSAIPGSITSEEFRADPARFADRPVVAYCTIGERSARFAQEMAQSGVEVFNFEGSILAWTHEGGPLVDANGPTRDVHVYGSTWDLAASGFQTTW